MSDEEESEGGHGDEELWLVSYADMMTLLFGFFVLMYSFAQAKLERMPNFDHEFVVVRKEVAKYFGGQYVTPFDKTIEEFKSAMGGEIDEQAVEIKTSPEGIDIRFQSSALFPLGSAELNEPIKLAIRKLATMALETKGQYQVKVEGHTDDVPIVAAKARYPTNWELSGARAASVVRVFEDVGFPSQSLVAIGYGSSRPLFPNRTIEDGDPIPVNQAKNRRIEIKVIQTDEVKPDPKDVKK